MPMVARPQSTTFVDRPDLSRYRRQTPFVIQRIICSGDPNPTPVGPALSDRTAAPVGYRSECFRNIRNTRSAHRWMIARNPQVAETCCDCQRATLLQL